jgi:hypothetical protein
MAKGWMLVSAFALATMAGSALAQGVPVDPQDTSGLRKVGAEVLFWSQLKRDANFPHMEKIFPGHVVKAGGKVRALPTGKPLPFPDAELDAFIAAQNISGLIVVQDPARALRPWLQPGWAVDQLLGREVVHFDPGRRGDPGRPYQVGRRAGDQIHPRAGRQRV